MKKLYLSILYVVIISILISGTILLCKPHAGYSAANNSFADARVVNDVDNASAKKIIAAQNDKIALKHEDIDIFDNETKTNLHADLSENKYGLVTLNLGYKLDGKLVTRTIDAAKIKEIRNIFNYREKYHSGYTINNMFLNEKMKKIYFCIEGRKEKKFSRTAVYSYNLSDSRIEKIFYAVGEFYNFTASPNGKYNAVTYLTSPLNIPNNERTVLVIFDCENNRQVFNSESDIKKDSSILNEGLYVFNYSFVKWQDSNIFGLHQKIRARDGLQKDMEKTLYYNITSRQFQK